MLKIGGYRLQSFSIGTKHARAFSFDNCSGIITDYVLAECGSEKSPLPAELYNRISFGDGAVKLHSEDDTSFYTVTRDNILMGQRTPSIEKNLEDDEKILKRAMHIMPGTLAFINNPKAKFLGMVWQYAEQKRRERGKLKHPVAEGICPSLLKFELKSNEYVAEVGARIAFRKKVPSSYLLRGQDDVLNIMVTIGDAPINDLWPESEDTRSRTQVREDTRIGVICLDIQILFDPLRRVSDKIIDAHWDECLGMQQRIAELLKGVGLEAE